MVILKWFKGISFSQREERAYGGKTIAKLKATKFWTVKRTSKIRLHVKEIGANGIAVGDASIDLTRGQVIDLIKYLQKHV